MMVQIGAGRSNPEILPPVSAFGPAPSKGRQRMGRVFRLEFLSAPSGRLPLGGRVETPRARNVVPNLTCAEEMIRSLVCFNTRRA